MSLLTILVVLVVVGVVLWLIHSATFIDARIKQIAFWVIIAFVLIWVLKALGFWGALGQVRI
jgi:hypothetical protein